MIFDRKAALAAALALGLALALAPGCEQGPESLKDGYYTAEMADYGQDGWKEYLTIYVNDGTIASAEFNAVNRGGLLRSWDQDFIQRTHLKYKIHPNLFPRLYASYLVSVKEPARILPVAPARRTHEVFIRLAEAALAGSRAGDMAVRIVPRPPTSHPDDI
jgi:major membrane immunogen (membrane-anchored lipoprotein)